MPQVLRNYATPFITGFFVISLVSGIGLFFHFGPSGFRGMHEWLSMVLILPFVLHLWKNWRPMLTYFQRAPMLIALALSLAVAAPFLMPSSGGEAGGPPQFQLAHKLMSQGVANVAPALGTTPEALTASLTAAGIAVTDPALSLAELATASGKSEMDVARVLIAPAS